MSSLRGQSVAPVVAFGRLGVTGYLTPRGVTDHSMGLRDYGNDPVTLTQTRCPGARVRGSDQDISALGVPRGAGIEPQFNRLDMRAFDRAGAVSLLGGLGGSQPKRLGAAR